MHYLYHGVPRDLKGDILYPLNILKEVDSDLYARKVQKYSGREKLLERRVPTLDCLWNDVLHFTAVKPEVIASALAKAGRTHVPMRFYQVDPDLVNEEKITVYLYRNKDGAIQVPEDEFVRFNANDLPKYQNIPDFTKKYYMERYAVGEKPFLYHGVPHILYKGSLCVKDLPIITV